MAAAILCAAALANAQSPATTTASTSTTGNDKITVSGCLQGGAASSSTTASTSTDSSSNAGYVLIASPMASDTTAGTAGSTSTTSTTSTTDTKSNPRMRGGTRYMLDGSNSELQKHVGHRIEVTGTVGSHDAHGAAATSTTTSGSASTRMNAPTQTLKVASVKMISASCSAR